MSKEIKWTKHTLEKFCEYALLNEEEIYIMKSRIAGSPISEQAYHLNCSNSTVSRMISTLKKKYDVVQKEHPDIFPIRKYSSKETWMDEH